MWYAFSSLPYFFLCFFVPRFALPGVHGPSQTQTELARHAMQPRDERSAEANVHRQQSKPPLRCRPLFFVLLPLLVLVGSAPVQATLSKKAHRVYSLRSLSKTQLSAWPYTPPQPLLVLATHGQRLALTCSVPRSHSMFYGMKIDLCHDSDPHEQHRRPAVAFYYRQNALTFNSVAKLIRGKVKVSNATSDFILVTLSFPFTRFHTGWYTCLVSNETDTVLTVTHHIFDRVVRTRQRWESPLHPRLGSLPSGDNHGGNRSADELLRHSRAWTRHPQLMHHKTCTSKKAGNATQRYVEDPDNPRRDPDLYPKAIQFSSDSSYDLVDDIFYPRPSRISCRHRRLPHPCGYLTDADFLHLHYARPPPRPTNPISWWRRHDEWHAAQDFLKKNKRDRVAQAKAQLARVRWRLMLGEAALCVVGVALLVLAWALWRQNR
ncbi:membrane protein A1 [Aotine betaherpesvirus 1]|uniref:Membrane protein A1 n=1 Tax=Aotine betaherpesvirus 1 TaxID=50290 RepID=G8XU73_9BETA|nr:membrane protein A1 [Aotine betaherpesvirus 1]AEV80715.1 membrane protein A1 [Aotine betaherpesvirus 1]